MTNGHGPTGHAHAGHAHDGHDHGDQVIGYMRLRRAIGLLGVAFPLWLWAWRALVCGLFELKPTISDYYHTVSHDWFVGILAAIGIFFWSYRGPKGEDALWANLAAAGALGVAFFPARSDLDWVRMAHTICAVGLFLVLAWFCLKIFTKHGGSRTPQKKQRDVIYRVCGWAILVCIGLIGVWWLIRDDAPAGLADLEPVFWLESLALWAFGLSWLTKGEVLCGDPKHA